MATLFSLMLISSTPHLMVKLQDSQCHVLQLSVLTMFWLIDCYIVSISHRLRLLFHVQDNVVPSSSSAGNPVVFTGVLVVYWNVSIGAYNLQGLMVQYTGLQDSYRQTCTCRGKLYKIHHTFKAGGHMLWKFYAKLEKAYFFKLLLKVLPICVKSLT